MIKASTQAFKNVQDACSRIAEHVPKAVSELDQALFGFVVRNDPSQWEHFQRKSLELKEWINEQKSAVPSVKMGIALERFSLEISAGEVLDQIGQTYERYLFVLPDARVRALHEFESAVEVELGTTVVH